MKRNGVIGKQAFERNYWKRGCGNEEAEMDERWSLFKRRGVDIE